MRTIAIQRDPRFSPNSVEKDLAILSAVALPMEGKIIAEGELTIDDVVAADTILNMGRMTNTLQLLGEYGSGKCIVNSPVGIRNCQRSRITTLMHHADIPTPPEKGSNGYWIKRGDEAAQTQNDVLYCANEAQLEAAKAVFQSRNITNMVVQAHVEGDLVKFYGVEDTAFFRYFYPTDDGATKFGDEQRNGIAHHYAFDSTALAATTNRLATLAETPVYGGDAIITAEGTFCIIDFNDWPSFSRCKDEAAKAIISCVAARQNL